MGVLRLLIVGTLVRMTCNRHLASLASRQLTGGESTLQVMTSPLIAWLPKRVTTPAMARHRAEANTRARPVRVTPTPDSMDHGQGDSGRAGRTESGHDHVQ
jgi:hypothetical protein